MNAVTQNTPAGSTVHGIFTVYTTVFDEDGRPVAKKVTLPDHHSVLLGVQGAQALVAYAGTDDDSANSRRAGFVLFPRNDVDAAQRAGWRVNGKFFIDGSKLALVPVSHLTVRGRLSNKLFTQVVARIQAVKPKPLAFSAEDEELVTGAKRAQKCAVR